MKCINILEMKKEIKTKAIQEMFNEMSKDYPKLFNTHTLEGREFISKYHEMVAEYDNLFYSCVLAMRCVLITNPELTLFNELIKHYEKLQKTS
jgi:hypothetical protein